jgi:hypothetical protein
LLVRSHAGRCDETLDAILVIKGGFRAVRLLPGSAGRVEAPAGREVGRRTAAQEDLRQLRVASPGREADPRRIARRSPGAPQRCSRPTRRPGRVESRRSASFRQARVPVVVHAPSGVRLENVRGQYGLTRPAPIRRPPTSCGPVICCSKTSRAASLAGSVIRRAWRSAAMISGRARAVNRPRLDRYSTLVEDPSETPLTGSGGGVT